MVVKTPLSADETQSAIEIPDHGRVRHRLDHTGKGIYFDRQMAWDLDPENAFSIGEKSGS